MKSSVLALGLVLTFISGSSAEETRTAAVRAEYAKLPLAFSRMGEGKGARFISRGEGYDIELEGARAAIHFGDGAANANVTLEFAGGKRGPGVAAQQLPGIANYVIGADPAKWRLGIKTFERVTYENVYPGIDVAYRGNQRQLEFDLILKPGADPRRIRLRFGGAKGLSVQEGGALILSTVAGALSIHLPAIYQNEAGQRRKVHGRFAFRKNGEVGFELEEYDRTRQLTIDPVIAYAALVAGGQTEARSIAVDGLGNAYVAGSTTSSGFPIVNTYPSRNAGTEAFIFKLNAAGSEMLYSTVFGGSGTDLLYGIDVDSAGGVWAAGFTSSLDFPAINGQHSSGWSAVVVRLDPSGAPTVSTSLGYGTGANAVAAGPDGSAYVAGIVSDDSDGTASPTPGAFLTTRPGQVDAFVARFSASGNLVYSTYLGGAGDESGFAIAVDALGNAYCAGNTTSASFVAAPAGGAQPANGGGADAFVAKLNPAGTALTYFTFLGGAGSESANGIAVDSAGEAYFAGSTSSLDLPTTEGAVQRAQSGVSVDAFIAKLNPLGSAFEYLTYLGGERADLATAIAVDASGNAYVTGITQSQRFPTVNAIESAPIANATSLFRTTDAGASWSSFDGNLPAVVYAISPDPSNPNIILAGADAGVFRTVDGGASWTRTADSPVVSFSRTPGNGNSVYALSNSLLPLRFNAVNFVYRVTSYRSEDGGPTWTKRASLGTMFRPSLAAIGGDSSKAYVSTDSDIMNTTDGGANWRRCLGTGLPNHPYGTIAAAADGMAYFGFANRSYRTLDCMRSWTLIGNYPFALSPANSAVIYDVNPTTAQLRKSTDRGDTWSLQAGVLPVAPSTLAVSPADPSTIYATGSTSGGRYSYEAATSSGAVYISRDEGASWAEAGFGLGLRAPTQIVPDYANPNLAYAISPTSQSAFISKIDPSGTSLLYSTYIGASDETSAYGIAVDDAGNVSIAGSGTGTFPSSTQAWQGSPTETQALVLRVSESAAPCTYAITPASPLAYGARQSFTYSMLAPAGCAWTASSNQLWARVLNAAGAGPSVVSLQLDQNATGAARFATIAIAGQEFTLAQAPLSCVYAISGAGITVGSYNANATIDPQGGSLAVNVTTAAACAWKTENYNPVTISVSSGASGTGSGMVGLSIGPNFSSGYVTRTVVVAGWPLVITQPSSSSLPYRVGDVAPSTADTAASFGDGALNILDLIQVLFAVNNVPGFTPVACSDRFDAMDLYPVDTEAGRGGDGTLNILDLIRELFRVNNLDLDRPVRASRGGVCAVSSGPVSSRRRRESAVTEGRITLGAPEAGSGIGERVAVYLEAVSDLSRVAVTLAAGDGRSKLRFEPAAGAEPTLVQDSSAGVIAAAWLDGLSVRAGGRLLLGYIEGPTGLSHGLHIYGASASRLDDETEVTIVPESPSSRR
jgi:photosystem II stability/assembly factor-like uncharacterized protein